MSDDRSSEQVASKRSWFSASHVGAFVLGGCAFWLVGAILEYRYEQAVLNDIHPGTHFPGRWATNDPKKLEHYEAIERIDKAMQFDLEKLDFSKWVRQNNIPLTSEQIDAITAPDDPDHRTGKHTQRPSN